MTRRRPRRAVFLLALLWLLLLGVAVYQTTCGKGAWLWPSSRIRF